MKIKAAAAHCILILLCFSEFARAQNYTITLYDQQNGAGNRIMTYTGPMLNNSQLNGTLISGFVLNPSAMHWTTPPIAADNQPGSLLPCSAYPDPGNGGPNGEASITCFSGAPGTSNGVPLFSFCFQGGAWPLPAGTYNVDSANQGSCGNYFYAYSQTPGYSSYAFVNGGSIVVVKNSTRIVTSLADDGSPGTLRSVIASANSGDTITFAVTGTITLAQGTLEINKNLTVSGPGAANLTVSGNHAYTVFQVDSGAGVNISGVTVQDGLGGVNGGDVANYGVITLTSSTLLATTPSNGQGGGLYNAGTATVAQCTFTGNPDFGTASNGGGIYNGGTLSVVGSTFSNFGVGGYGAAIFNAGYFQSAAGTGTVTNSTFWQNAANEGAAIFDAGTSGNITLVNSTLSGNSGNSIIYTLYGGTTLKNTLIANSGGKNCYGNNGPIKSGGYNLSDDSSCSAYFTQTGDINNTPAGLDPNGLKDNGGPTQTVAILATSPAFNVIPLSPTNYCTGVDGKTPIATDQRGIQRPQVSACDIGAFEYSSDNDMGFALLTGGNTFTGNQMINGTVTAMAFVGDGSGLTGVNAASANIANLANYATSAGDAATLGGNPPSAFAPASGSPNYVAKSGDTMTGTLNLASNGLTVGGNQLAFSNGNIGIGTTTPETLPSYTSMHIDYSGTGFGGSFLELTHSATGAKGRVVMDDHGFLLNAVSSAPVKIKAGSTFNGGTDPGDIYISPNGNVGIWTGTPAATLDVNGTANFAGLVTFAPGQTFPGTGSGTITGVTAGTGLAGGGTNGNVTLTNTGLLSLLAGTGLTTTAGQAPTVSLDTNFTDSRYLQLSGGNVSGTLNLPPDGLVAGGNQLVLSGGNVGVGTATPEGVSGYTSLHIDNPGAGFGGSFLELTHSPTGAKGRVVMDDNGLLLAALSSAPVKIKSGNFNGGGDPGHIYVSTGGNVGIGTGTPAAKLEVNGTAQFDNTVTFAPGQTFPGTGNGTITGVTAGTGLAGGGTSGNVSLTVDSTVARTNASNTFSAPQTVSGAVTATSFAGSGAGLSNLPAANLTGSLSDANLPSDVARLGTANAFTNLQSISVTTGNQALLVSNTYSTGVIARGIDYGVYGSGAWGLYGSTTSVSGVGVQGTGGTSGAGVAGLSYNGVAVSGVTTSAGIAGVFNATNGGKVLSGQNNGAEVFSVANNGNVNTSGNLATVGSVTIGSGTPITKHISMLFQNVAFNTKMSPATCTVWTGTVSGAADGDTVAVGLGSSLMSANIVYSAWATSGGVSVRICNPTGAPTTVGAGNIRVDVWKH